MTVRSGVGASILAILLVVLAAVLMTITATELPRLIRGLMVAAVLVHAVVIFLGSSRLVATSSVFMLVAVTLEPAMSDDPSWVRSIAVGLIWYIAMEVSWHALDRRDGTIYTSAALARRVQDVTVVVGLSLVVGLVAIAAATFAPGRSVGLQALVLGAVLAALAVVVRQLAPDDDPHPSVP